MTRGVGTADPVLARKKALVVLQEIEKGTAVGSTDCEDQLRAARVPVAVQNAILSYVDGSVGRSYGLGYPVSVLLEAVSKTTIAGWA